MTFQVYQRFRVAAHLEPRALSNWLGRLTALVVPPRCLLCGSADCAAGVDLCHQCEADLPVAAQPLQPHSHPLSATFSPWRYDYPVNRLIRALKFNGDRSVARTLGGLLAGHRARLAAPLPELLVPVPLHAARLRARGYNQADEIARYAAATLGMKRLPALLRVRDTPEQSRLTAVERRRNLTNAFSVRPSVHTLLHQRRIALIDDVVTTGSTARAAAAALLDAQAAQVELWTLARAE